MRSLYLLIVGALLFGCVSIPTEARYARNVVPGAELCFMENGKFLIVKKSEKMAHVTNVSVIPEVRLHCNNGSRQVQKLQLGRTWHLSVMETKWISCGEIDNFCTKQSR